MLERRGVWALCAAVLGLGAAPLAASAGGNDLVMSRLGVTLEDSSGNPTGAIGSSHDFRSLTSELGVVMAPRLLTPSDTLGFAGFQFSADVAYTSITNDAPYWRVLSGSNDPDNPSAVHGKGLMPTVGLFVRKGMWMPLPSFEVGLGAVHLLDSQLWSGQAYAKFALHEGYHDLPLPSFAVRGAASRLMGSSELDLTVASFDVSASKAFGIGGVVNLAPYAGWNLLIIVPRSKVIDKTPHIDPLTTTGDSAMNFVFRDQDDILRHRLFGGFKLKYYVFAITFEAALALAGSSVDDRRGTDVDCAAAPSPTTFCNSTDAARLQETYTVSVALDF